MGSDFAAERDALVARLLDQGALTSAPVAAAMRRVPRERFVPAEWRARAYDDTPLPLEGGQTVSAPHMVAMMAEALDPRPGDRVLEVGGGSGYHAAVLAELVGPEGRVHTVEVLPELAEAARRHLDDGGYAQRVKVHVGDGSTGWPDAAPYNRISVACAAPAPPTPLLEQLEPGGTLVIPLGDAEGQTLFALDKDEGGTIHRRPLAAVRFVPLVGVHGFTKPPR